MHTVADVIRFRLLMIAAGYADGNDATSLQTPQVPRLPVVLEMNFHAFGHARSIAFLQPENSCITHLPIVSFGAERLQSPPRAGPVSSHGWIPFMNFLD